MMVSPLINFAPIRESHNVLLAQLRQSISENAFRASCHLIWIFRVAVYCIETERQFKFKDGDTEREIFSKFPLRLEPVRRVGREISLLFGRTIIRVMVGVGRKNSGKGKCSPTNSCKGWARFFTLKPECTSGKVLSPF